MRIGLRLLGWVQDDRLRALRLGGAGSPWKVVDVVSEMDKNELMLNETARSSACVARTGTALTSIPGLSASVPKINNAFLGLMQYSSILIFALVSTP